MMSLLLYMEIFQNGILKADLNYKFTLKVYWLFVLQVSDMAICPSLHTGEIKLSASKMNDVHNSRQNIV